MRKRHVFTANSGLLNLAMSGKRTENIQFTNWKMSAVYIRLRGWVLNFHITTRQGHERIPFGFYFRHNDPSHLLVTSVNSLNRKLLKKLRPKPVIASLQY
jgi:hypothetical protein